MATLRDAKTSEFLFEGSDEEAVLLANAIGLDEVLFDNVGEHFDPVHIEQALDERQAHNESQTTNADETIKQTAQDEVDAVAEIRASAQEAQAEAESLLQEARAKVKE